MITTQVSKNPKMVIIRHDDGIQQTPIQCQHMWIIIGLAGCGKSTVAEQVARDMGLPFIEGDSVCLKTYQ
jgi:adenylylsulfate kinase-like enzyme